MRLALTALISVALAVYTHGQSHQLSKPQAAASTNADGPDTSPEIPTHMLKFKATETVPGLTASPVMFLPTQCTSDGTLFLDMLTPPDFKQRALYSANRDKSTAFLVSTIADLHGAEVISSFPSESTVGMLVRGSKSSAVSANKIDPLSFRYYVAEFDKNGTYKGSIELSLHNFTPFQLAILNSGKFLITGFDRADDLPRLLLVDDNGGILHPIPMPEAMERYAQPADPASPEAVTASGKLMGSISFTSYGENILVWRIGVTAPVLVVGPGGNAQELTLDSPKGFVLADVVPTGTKLIVHYKPAGRREGADINQDDTAYYELNPSDGSLISRLQLSGDTSADIPGSIACEAGGEYIGYRTDDKGKLTRLLAR